ncbi:hypothetical protein GCM10027447_11990 [Glycomyces halotolerans]
MSGLRDSVRALGIDDPETAIAVHALVGSDPALLAHAGTLPGSLKEVPDWVQSTFLNADNPLFDLAEHAVERALGGEADERTDKILSMVAVRPRTVADLEATTGFDGLDGIFATLEQAGLVRVEPNPLEPEHPFWTMKDRLARFYYAMMVEHLPRWRRGYITDRLWRMTHARFDRYVCRAEYARVAREWALDDPEAERTTRIVVPDPRFRQLRTLEVAAWRADGSLAALGTIRWMFRMRHRQLQRLRHVRRLLGDPPSRLYCIAPRVEPAIAADDAPDVFRIGPAHLLRRD